MAPLGLWFPEGGEAIRDTGWVIRFTFALNLAVSGFMLNSGKLVRQAANFRAIFLTLGATYVLAPLYAYALARLWSPAASTDDSAQRWFVESVLIMAAQAGTLATAPTLTLLARGNRELAMVITLLSNTLTVFLTPLVLQITLGASVDFRTSEMIMRMAFMVLLPVALGQLVRAFLWRQAQSVMPALRIIPQCIILFFLYIAFAAAAEHLGGDLFLVGRFAGACASLHVALLFCNYTASRLLNFSAPTRTAIIYCGSQKTLPNGIYVWETFFASNVYGAVPLAIYHLFQTVTDSFLAPFLEKQNARSKTSPGPTPN